MSMISALIDRLRKAAQNCHDMGKYEAEQMLLDAADTIWQLRDSLQRMNAENAKLRELAEAAWKTAERLCQAFEGPCSDAPLHGSTNYKPCPLGERDEECVYGQLQRELRKLGVEVDNT